MRSNLFLFLIASLLLITGCGKDEIIETTSDPIIPGPTVQIEASVRGIVTDENNNAISNVLVENENERIQSDDNGYFKFASESLLEGGARMKFEKDGYFTNYKFTNPSPGGTTFLKVQLIERKKTQSFGASSGGTVTTSQGASVIFTPNSIIDANGNSYSGNVNVYAHWYNPEDPAISKTMPGDLRAIDTEDQIVQLATFGMMAVELESDNGEALNIASGSTATLEFPLSNALQANAPDEIPLWSFDEQTAYWTEEGTAKLEGGKYVGAVSHFSFWNCDAPFPVVKINGRLIDTDGNPIKWAEICIAVTTSGLTGYGWSDQNGNFCGKIPKDKTLSIKVKDECGNVIYEEVPVGPFGSTTDLGDIVIDQNDYTNVIKGSLVDCNGMPVTNGYVIMTFENGFYTVLDLDANGDFEGFVINCQSTEFTLQGFDIDNLTETEIIDVTSVPGQPIVLDGIPTCDDLGEYIRFKVKENGVEGDYNLFTGNATNINVIMTDQNLTISAGLNGYWITITLDDVTGSGDYTPSSFFVLGEGPNGDLYDFFCSSMPDSTGVEVCDLEVTISSIGIVGEYVVGEFVATNLNASNSLIDICGDFKVELDIMNETASVEGVVWDDENKNGIREPGERFLEGINVRLRDKEFLFQQEVTTASDGTYRFENITPRSGYYMALTNAQGYLPSLGGQTPDPSLDNNFEFVISTGSQQGQLIQTVNFDLLDGDDLLNMDAGIYEKPVSTLNCSIDGDFALCEGQDGILSASAQGGDGNYTYSWNNGSTEQTISIWDPGYYSVTIIDGNGEFCETGFDVDILFTNTAEFNVLNETCSNGNGAIEISTFQSVFNEILMDGVLIGNNDVTVDNLSEGNYEFVIINELGCETFYSIYVSNIQSYIGDFVWKDNLGGEPNIYDSGDTGMGGVKVRLFEELNSIAIDSMITTTGIDSSGFYHFVGDFDGNYFIEIELPEPMVFEFVEQGTDPNWVDLDSNIDPLTGRSDIFVIEECESHYNIDAGIREQ